MRLRSGSIVRSYLSLSMSENVNLTDLLKPLETNLQELQSLLQQNIEKINSSIAEIKVSFEKQLESQNTHINSLQTDVGNIKVELENKDRTINNLLLRVKKLEKISSFNLHVISMQGRKMDDFEQISRKQNLKLSGIEVGLNDSPAVLMDKIKDEVIALDIIIPDHEFDRCHRVGRKYKKNGKTFQNVLLKLCSWRARDTIYQNRKLFSFKINHDLTTRRQDLLNFAIKESLVSDTLYVDYIFADRNCILKIKSKAGQYMGFNSETEYYSLIHRLRFEHFATKEHLADIEGNEEVTEKDDLYY